MEAIADLRILHVSTSRSVGGVERVILNIVEGINDLHGSSAVAVVHKSDFPRLLQSRGAAVFAVGPQRMGGRRLGMPSLLGLYQVVRRWRPTLLHGHGFEAAIACRLVSVWTRLPCIVTVHGTTFGDYPPWKAELYRRIDAATSGWSLNVAVSNAVRDVLGGYGVKVAAVVYNGVPLPTVRPRRCGRPLSVGVVGRIVPGKGHHAFVRALAALDEVTRRALRVVIAGEGPLQEEVEQLVRALGLGEMVRFRGYSEDMSSVYSGLDMLVFPSTAMEGLPMAILEAMSYGIPVIASRVGGVPEIVRHGETGLLVNPGDAEAVARALAVLVDDDELRWSMGIAARQRIEREFTHEQMGRRYAGLYVSLRTRGRWALDEG